MVILYVQFKTELPEEKVLEVARTRQLLFKEVAGLVQTFYLKPHSNGYYGGMYVWETKEAMDNYRKSDLAKRLPDDYQIIGAQKIQVMDVFLKLP